MNKSMRECMKKLALWYTKTFRPLVTHEELEPIMATLGFIVQPDKPAQNGVYWREYIYVTGAVTSEMSLALPRPKLPSHRIDGLHIYTYRAFIDAVNFYLEMHDVSNLFHIRGMPLHRVYDCKQKFCRMDGNESIFVYREGTLEQSIYNYYSLNNNVDDNNVDDHELIDIRNKGNNPPIGTIVELKDIAIWSFD